MNKEKEKIIRSFIHAYNTFDIESMTGLLHPEIQFKNISRGNITAQTKGKIKFNELAKQSAAIFKNREQKIISYKETNDKIILEIQFKAELVIDLSNGLKKGDILELQGKSEYVFKNGKIYSIIDES